MHNIISCMRFYILRGCLTYPLMTCIWYAMINNFTILNGVSYLPWVWSKLPSFFRFNQELNDAKWLGRDPYWFHHKRRKERVLKDENCMVFYCYSDGPIIAEMERKREQMHSVFRCCSDHTSLLYWMLSLQRRASVVEIAEQREMLCSASKVHSHDTKPFPSKFSILRVIKCTFQTT